MSIKYNRLKHNRLLLYIFPIFLFSCQSEDLSDTQIDLKNSAIPIHNLQKLNNKLYNEISPYTILMIGEMHGTNEPAEFAYGLCKLISQKEEQVIMGMEIPPRQMETFSQSMTAGELKNLNFFDGENSSGMNGQAWLNLITRCNQHENIIVEFFDHQSVSPRDSSMYNAIVDIRKNHPNTKIVTLSGNLHNKLEPFNGKTMLGGYLKNDTKNFDPNKIMSIMHYFNQGTMLNNVGNGLELTTIEPKEDIFNKTLSTNMLFCKNIFEDRHDFTHILYTDNVSHSEILAGQ